MKSKPISKHFFPRKPLFILWVLVFVYSCNLKSEPPLFVPAPKSPFAVGNGPADVTLGYVNGDAKLDIITVNYESRDVTILLGDGQGNFTPVKNSLSLDSTAHLVAMGDVNNDEKQDLAISDHHTYKVTVLLGDGEGNFTQALSSPFLVNDSTKPHNHGLALGDVNKDGNIDIVTSNHGHQSVSVMLGNGKGGFTPVSGSPFTVGRGPYPLALEDVNKDGNLDIITPNVSSNNVTVLLGNGKGIFSQAINSPYPVETRPFFATTGDINGDGNVDIITAHDDINKISFLLGDGKGGFKSAPNSPFDLGKRAWKIVLADANQDNKKDLIFNNLGSNDISVWESDGKGNFKPAAGSPYKVGDDPEGIAVGDLNGDAKPDIVVANSSSNNVSVLLAR